MASETVPVSKPLNADATPTEGLMTRREFIQWCIFAPATAAVGYGVWDLFANMTLARQQIETDVNRTIAQIPEATEVQYARGSIAQEAENSATRPLIDLIAVISGALTDLIAYSKFLTVD